MSEKRRFSDVHEAVEHDLTVIVKRYVPDLTTGEWREIHEHNGQLYEVTHDRHGWLVESLTRCI